MTTSSRRTQANQHKALQSTNSSTVCGQGCQHRNAVQHGIMNRHLIMPGKNWDEFDAPLLQLKTVSNPWALWRKRWWSAWRLRQASMQPRAVDVLSRYQSSLDNDLYKAMHTQRHRLEQATLTVQSIGPMGSTT